MKNSHHLKKQLFTFISVVALFILVSINTTRAHYELEKSFIDMMPQVSDPTNSAMQSIERLNAGMLSRGTDREISFSTQLWRDSASLCTNGAMYGVRKTLITAEEFVPFSQNVIMQVSGLKSRLDAYFHSFSKEGFKDRRVALHQFHHFFFMRAAQIAQETDGKEKKQTKEELADGISKTIYSDLMEVALGVPFVSGWTSLSIDLATTSITQDVIKRSLTRFDYLFFTELWRNQETIRKKVATGGTAPRWINEDRIAFMANQWSKRLDKLDIGVGSPLQTQVTSLKKPIYPQISQIVHSPEEVLRFAEGLSMSLSFSDMRLRFNIDNLKGSGTLLIEGKESKYSPVVLRKEIRSLCQEVRNIKKDLELIKFFSTPISSLPPQVEVSAEEVPEDQLPTGLSVKRGSVKISKSSSASSQDLYIEQSSQDGVLVFERFWIGRKAKVRIVRTLPDAVTSIYQASGEPQFIQGSLEIEEGEEANIFTPYSSVWSVPFSLSGGGIISGRVYVEKPVYPFRDLTIVMGPAFAMDTLYLAAANTLLNKEYGFPPHTPWGKFIYEDQGSRFFDEESDEERLEQKSIDPLVKARSEAQKAADQGSVADQALYGRMLYEGKGGSIDYTEARRYLKMAADNGIRSAEELYISMLARGQGGPADLEEVSRYEMREYQRREEEARQFVKEAEERWEQDYIREVIAKIREKTKPTVGDSPSSTRYLEPLPYPPLPEEEVLAQRNKARLEAKKAADTGATEFQTLYGFMLCEEKPEIAGLIEARRYLKLAADKGNMDAQSFYGRMLYEGKGGSADHVGARQYFKMAADQGEINALRHYELMVVIGEGGPADPTEAQRCREIGEARAREMAERQREIAEQSEREARERQREATKEGYLRLGPILKDKADKGEIEAQSDYGMLLYEMLRYEGKEDPKEGPVDYFGEAGHYLKMAADKDNMGAQFNYGMLLFEGKGGDKDLAQARVYFKKAAVQGLTRALEVYAFMLFNGDGGPVQLSEALKYCQMAVDKGSTSAQVLLPAILAAMDAEKAGRQYKAGEPSLEASLDYHFGEY